MHIFSTFPLSLVGIVLFLAVIGVLVRRFGSGFRRNSEGQSVAESYEPAPALLTPAERSFFGVLQQAVSSAHQVFAKVRLADIVRPVRNPSRSGWPAAFNRITGKHVDFVLCDKSSLRVVCVVELDDKTHQRFERGVRDGLVDAALADAGIPILRFPARQSYSPVQIRDQVEDICGRKQIVEPNSAALVH